MVLIEDWALQWKKLFNLDLSSKQLKFYFLKKLLIFPHPILTFNNNIIGPKDSHKNLGFVLDKKLAFDNHLKDKISKVNKGIGLIFYKRGFRQLSFLPGMTIKLTRKLLNRSLYHDLSVIVGLTI